jgi:hypothetical protein
MLSFTERFSFSFYNQIIDTLRSDEKYNFLDHFFFENEKIISYSCSFSFFNIEVNEENKSIKISQYGQIYSLDFIINIDREFNDINNAIIYIRYLIKQFENEIRKKAFFLISFIKQSIKNKKIELRSTDGIDFNTKNFFCSVGFFYKKKYIETTIEKNSIELKIFNEEDLEFGFIDIEPTLTTDDLNKLINYLKINIIQNPMARI